LRSANKATQNWQEFIFKGCFVLEQKMFVIATSSMALRRKQFFKILTSLEKICGVFDQT